MRIVVVHLSSALIVNGQLSYMDFVLLFELDSLKENKDNLLRSLHDQILIRFLRMKHNEEV